MLRRMWVRKSRFWTLWLWAALALMPLRGLTAGVMGITMGPAGAPEVATPCHGATHADGYSSEVETAVTADTAHTSVAHADGNHANGGCTWCDVCHVAAHAFPSVSQVVMAFAPPRVAREPDSWQTCALPLDQRPPSL